MKRELLNYLYQSLEKVLSQPLSSNLERSGLQIDNLKRKNQFLSKVICEPIWLSFREKDL